MNSDDVWARCQQCDTELKQGDKVCPKCGSTKKRIVKIEHAVVAIKENGKRVHNTSFDAKSLGILAAIIAIVAILLTLLVPSLPYRIRIALAAIALVIVLVVIFNNKTRYSLIMFLRWLNEKLAARKTYGDEKPANRDD